MKVFLGCDHGGFGLKNSLVSSLKEQGHEIHDLGASSFDKDDDYVDFAFKVAQAVSKDEQKSLFQEGTRGILLCRSAAGMVMAANKVRGIRAAAAFDERSAVHSREHNASNVLALSGDWTNEDSAIGIVSKWLNARYSNDERHTRRLKKIAKFEAGQANSHYIGR